MRIPHISKIQWERGEEWFEKWYNHELCFMAFGKNANPLAKIFSQSGVNVIALNTQWYYDKSCMGWGEERQNAVRKGTVLFEKLVNETELYIQEAENTLKDIEKTAVIDELKFKKIKRVFLLMWYVFLCDLGKQLTPYLNERFSKKGLTGKQIDILLDYILNFKYKLAFQQEENDLAKIYFRLKKRYSGRRVNEKNIPVEFKKLMSDHWNKYRWMTAYNLDMNPFSLNDYYNKLEEVGLKKERRRKVKIPENVKKQLNKDDLRLIELVRKHTFYDNYGADLYIKLDFLLCEYLSRKYALSFKELSWYSVEELECLIKVGRKVSQRQLRIRGKDRVMVCIKGRVAIYYGKRYDQIHKIVTKNKRPQSIKELKGSIASRGYSKGTIKIVQTIKDIDKLERGEILVATTTYPDLMLAIKRCSGIITDVGGIASHAAIISREFGIPCIVGTDIATQVLKDGDLVELDAINGVIRLL